MIIFEFYGIMKGFFFNERKKVELIKRRLVRGQILVCRLLFIVRRVPSL